MNKKDRREYNRKYYQEHKEYFKNWRKTHPESVAKSNKNAYLKHLKPNEARYAKQLERNRWNARKRKYGISKEQYQDLLLSQNSQCPICGVHDDNLRVDHDHATKKIRGLLCHKCNAGLGLFDEDQNILERASLYLQRFL